MVKSWKQETVDRDNSQIIKIVFTQYLLCNVQKQIYTDFEEDGG